MKALIRFLFFPAIVVGMVWYVTKSAFVSGQMMAQDYMFELFDEENEDSDTD